MPRERKFIKIQEGMDFNGPPRINLNTDQGWGPGGHTAGLLSLIYIDNYSCLCMGPFEGEKG